MARGRQLVRRGGQRRMSSWLDLPPTSTGLASASAIILALTTAEKAKRPFTIVRTHLVVQIVTDQLAADELQVGAIGGCVVSDQAVGIGVTAVPTPETDAASDFWFLHQWLISDFALASSIGFDADAGHIYTIDSKAMRKVNEDEDIIFVIEGGSVLGSGVAIRAAGRMLIKEH